MRQSVLLFLLAGLMGSCTTTPVETPEEPDQQRTASALTVYNAGRALVKDTRSFALDEGLNTVRFDEVTSGIIPGSVHVEPVGDAAVAVHEQNFEYDLVSTHKLLQRYLGEEIRITTEDGVLYSGSLLSGAGDVILRDSTGGVTVLRYDQIRDFEFPELPEGLASRPSLLWTLDAQQGGDQDLTVTYITSGFNWSADYIVRLGEQDDVVDLSGWVSVNNSSEASFEDTKLKLVAGDVNMVPTSTPDVTEALGILGYLGNGKGGGGYGPPKERAFFDYHLYELPQPVTVRAAETKQVEFANVSGIPAEVGYELQFDGYWYGTTVTRHPTVSVKLVNGEEQNLGIPLPAGIVRVYKDDIDGASELVGESRIEHTPREETVELNVGEAFDIVGEWKQTKHRVISDWTDEYAYEATLRNHKNKPVTVTMKHQPYHWGEWKVTKASVDHTRPDNAHLQFDIEVPAEGEITFTYTIRNRW